MEGGGEGGVERWREIEREQTKAANQNYKSVLKVDGGGGGGGVSKTERERWRR